jgi:hypothetical protein
LKDSYKLLERVYDDPDGARKECYCDIFNWNGPEITKGTLLKFIETRKKKFPEEYARAFFQETLIRGFRSLLKSSTGSKTSNISKKLTGRIDSRQRGHSGLLL